jgi:hypothetical protein
MQTVDASRLVGKPKINGFNIPFVPMASRSPGKMLISLPRDHARHQDSAIVRCRHVNRHRLMTIE